MRRALTEPLSVLALEGTPVESRDATVVMVVSGTGESYHVDVREGRYTRPDAEYNLNGGVVDADAGEIPGGDPRSGDCSCHSPKQGLPCWPYEGFRRPEPRSGRSGGNTS